MAIKAGHDALEVIKFFGPESAWSIGYRAVKARHRNGVRELLDVELYEVSPVLHGAHPDARLIDVKAARHGPRRPDQRAGRAPSRRSSTMTPGPRSSVPTSWPRSTG